MKHSTTVFALFLALGSGVSQADEPPATPDAAAAPEPPQIPRTHVDSTIVGDSTSDSANPHNAPTSLDNNHGFEAGAPELVRATAPLQLSVEQKTKMHTAIEKSDAAAAMLIKRENAVRQMLAATTPDNPGYAKLQAEQASQDSLWNDNRESLRRTVADLLTPMQRARFEQSQSRQ